MGTEIDNQESLKLSGYFWSSSGKQHCCQHTVTKTLQALE